MGWNKIKVVNSNPLIKPDETDYYFVHSYYAIPNDKSNIIANTNYGITFCSAFANKNYVSACFKAYKVVYLSIQDAGEISISVISHNFDEPSGCRRILLDLTTISQKL